MKKLVTIIIASMLSFTMASAEKGVNIGLSGQMGGFAASATESAGERDKEDAALAVGWASVFLEKELGDSPLAIGIDYVPQTLGSETATSERRQLTGVGKATTLVTQSVQVDFDNLYTIYLNLKMGENLYAKAGYMSVDVVTNETLGTGSRYNDGDMNGTLLGFGYNNDLDNGMFVRVEGNYMTFDGLTLTATNNAENQITLNTLDGASAKVSIGKSF